MNPRTHRLLPLAAIAGLALASSAGAGEVIANFNTSGSPAYAGGLTSSPALGTSTPSPFTFQYDISGLGLGAATKLKITATASSNLVNAGTFGIATVANNANWWEAQDGPLSFTVVIENTSAADITSSFNIDLTGASIRWAGPATLSLNGSPPFSYNSGVAVSQGVDLPTGQTTETSITATRTGDTLGQFQQLRFNITALPVTWTGGSANDGQWNRELWINFGGVAVGTNNDVVFGSANANGKLTTALGTTPITLKSLTFQSGSPAYDIRLAEGVLSTTAANLTFSSTNTGLTVASGDTSSHTIGQGSLGGSVVMAGDLTVTHNGSGTLAFDQPITGSGFGLTKAGTGTMKLNALNTYSDATQVDGGILVFGKTAAKASGTVAAGASGIVGLGVGGTGYYSAGDVESLSANTLAGFSLDPTSGVAIDTTAASLTSQTGPIVGTRSLTKLGANFAQLNGNNTYTGATIIKEGNLYLGAGSAGGKLINTSTITVESGAGFGIFQNDAVSQSGDFNNAPITGAGGFSIVGSSKVTLTAANNYTGTTAIAGGLLKHEGSATLTSGNLIFDGSSTSGVLGLTDNFTRSLGTGAGEVQWTKSGGFAAFGADRTVSLNGGGSVQWASGSFLPASRVLILGHPDATHSVTFTNDINFGIPVGAAIKTRDIRVDDGAAAVDAVISGILDSGGTLGGFNKVGTGTLELTNANTYTGITNIQEGRLDFSVAADGASPSSLGSSSNAAENLLLGTGSTLRYIGASGSTDRSFTINGTAAGNNATLDASGIGPINFTNPASPAYGTANQTRVLILAGTNTGDNTLAAGVVNNGTGVVSITKEGTGKWILSGTSNISGVAINDGTLLINGQVNGTSTVNVRTGGTLGGTGTIGKSVVVEAAGSLAPGNSSVGTLSFGSNLNVEAMANGTGKFFYELGSPASSDKINLTTGTLVVNTGVLDLDDFNFTAVGLQVGTYTLISTPNNINTTLGPNLSGTLGGKNILLQKSVDNKNLELVVSGLGSPYDTWATSKGLTGLPGSSTDPAKDADPDKDGRNNLAEFAFNGNPLSGADNGKVFVLTEDSDVDGDATKELLLTIAVRTGTPAFAGSPSPSANLAADGITYNVEGSLDLASFATTVNVVSPVTTGLPAAGTGYEYRSFSLGGSNGLTGKGFLRAKVTSP